MDEQPSVITNRHSFTMLGRVITGSLRHTSNGEGSSEEAEEAQEEQEELMKRRAKLGMVVDMAESSWIGGIIPSNTN